MAIQIKHSLGLRPAA